MTNTKTVTIGEVDFQVGLIPARTGNWILQQLMGGKWRDKEVWPDIEVEYLDVCYLLKDAGGTQPNPVKVYSKSERKFLIPDLNLDTDLWTLNRLEKQAELFNFGPFFEKLDAEAKKEKLSVEQPSDTSL